MMARNKIGSCVGSAAALGFLFALAGPARATEGAGSSYPVGVEVSYANLMPPGNYHFMYYSRYESDSIKGSNGRDNKAFKEFGLKGDGLAYRFQHVWTGKLFGAGVESAFSVPFTFMKLNKVTASGSSGGGTSGFGDPGVVPARLSWKKGIISQSVAVEFVAPLGNYDKDERVNTGRHYWQFASAYAVSVRGASGLEANARLRYGVNTQNPTTHYRSGSELVVDFSAGYKALPKTAFGLNGYHYKQTTNDEVRGVPTSSGVSPARGGLPNTGTGNKGQVTAVGPYISHSFSKKCMVLAKYQREFNAENRPRGDRFWLQALLPF